MTEKRQTSQGYIIRILQHFAMILLFQAVDEIFVWTWPDKEFDKNFLFQNMEKSSTKKKEIPREIANCHDIFPETNFITLILRSAIYTREESIAHVWLSRLIWPLAKDGIRKNLKYT